MSGCHEPKHNLTQRVAIADVSGIDSQVDYSPLKPKSDIQYLLDMIGDLSMRINNLHASFRTFEKERFDPLNVRLTELESLTRAEEDRYTELLNKHSQRLDDHEERLDEIEDGEY